MLQLLKKMLGSSPSPDLGTLIAQGAMVIDVRTPVEYAGGHMKESVNIPLSVLGANLKRIAKDKPVITCCASGMRSSSARKLLQSQGYKQVYNGGSWTNLRRYEQ